MYMKKLEFRVPQGKGLKELFAPTVSSVSM